MDRWNRFRLICAQSADNLPAVRQVSELQKQIPTLYGVLSVNTCAIAATHSGYAPGIVTMGFPAFAVSISLLRAVHWLRLRPETMTEAEAIRQLLLTTVMTGVLSLVSLAWAMVLHGYGGPYEQAHVVIFIAVTVIASINCLTHLPVAAFLVTGIVMSTLILICLTSGNAVFVAIAVNITFVTMAMVRVLSNNYRAFVALVASEATATRLSEDNAKLALTDSLTGLPNRRHFFQDLEDLTVTVGGRGGIFALAIFDLDQFKPINDTYGHTAGDHVLAEAGRRLAAFADDKVMVARLGGDEFGVLLHDPGDPEEAIRFCNAICETLQQPIAWGGLWLTGGCSGGLAKFPRAGREPATLFDRADYALYHSKLYCRGETTLFSQEHEDAIRVERAVETALRSVDLDAEMRIHYQPILDTETGRITLVEALARWMSPTLGQVPPDRFIAAAERCGMIHHVTLLLLRKALADCALLPPDVGLSFNLSAHDLASPETVAAIVGAVRKSGIDPRRMTLELTETALLRDFDQAKEAIVALRALGIKIALDDFGTGYSSLGYVHRLPLDKIKIDRSFIAAMDSDVGGSVIATILNLCENLGLDGIAEGVETEGQMAAIRRHGCRLVQGYLVGKPMPLAELLAGLPRAEPHPLRA